MAGAGKNPYLKANDWGWQTDGDGLRYALNEIYGRYEIPCFVVENGFGALDEVVVEDGAERIHDHYRTDYLRANVKAMVTVLCSVKIYSVFLEKGFTIKMPDSVPPAIGNSFASIIPFAVCRQHLRRYRRDLYGTAPMGGWPARRQHVPCKLHFLWQRCGSKRTPLR